MSESLNQIDFYINQIKYEEKLRKEQEAKEKEKLDNHWREIFRQEIGDWIANDWRIQGDRTKAFLEKEYADKKRFRASICRYPASQGNAVSYLLLISREEPGLKASDLDLLILEVVDLTAEQLSMKAVSKAIALMILDKADEAKEIFRQPDGSLRAQIRKNGALVWDSDAKQ